MAARRESQIAEPNPTHTPKTAGTGDGGGGMVERLVRIETAMSYMATKEDFAKVERLIVERETSMLRWLIGILLVTAVGMFTALVRLFLPA